MKPPLCIWLLLIAFVVGFPSRAALAEPLDGGMPTPDGGSSDGAPTNAPDGAAPPADEFPFACNKALCDTTTGETACSIAPGFGANGAGIPVWISVGLAIGLGTRQRRGRRAKERTR